MLAGQEGRFELVGDESLSRRPLERVAEPLRLMGATVTTTDGHAPLRARGRPLAPIRYELPVASAQVKSCVLLAGLYAESGPTTVVEPAQSRDHTERMLAAAGARVSRRPGTVSVWPVDRLAPLSLDVPGDFSSAAPFLAAATLLPGSELRLHGVGINPTRTGFLHVLERMGARISIYNRRSAGGEPIADLEVGSAELTATTIGPDEVPTLIDELPLFALCAAMARGESAVTGAQELRVKETDRVEAVTNAMRALGTRVTPSYDGFRVRGIPSRPQGGGVVDSARRSPHRDAGGAGRAPVAGGRRAAGRRVRRSKLPRLLRRSRLARSSLTHDDGRSDDPAPGEEPPARPRRFGRPVGPPRGPAGSVGERFPAAFGAGR